MKTKEKTKTDNIIIKAVIVVVLTLLMLIPIVFLKSLISEREEHKNVVNTEIRTKLGGTQTLTGPILVLPYEVIKNDQINGKEHKYNETGELYFLPENYEVAGELINDDRSRAQYKVLTYQSELKVNGKFSFPDIDYFKIKPEEVKWEDAYFLIGITHLQGIKNKIELNVNGIKREVEPGIISNKIINTGLTIKSPIDQNEKKEISFNFNLALNGTPGLFINPIGRETHVNLKSKWNTVSFSGLFLPSDKTIDDVNGFDAKWDIFDYNRNYVQKWKNEGEESLKNEVAVDFSDNSFNDTKNLLGVILKYPIDQYQMTMRSVKYAILFILLTFVAFMMIEILSSKPIHPIQYLLVSFALIIFYLLLLAFSEYIGFNFAYLISAVAVIGLITAYSSTILKNKKQTIIIGSFLIILYTFLYTILQLEDFALLFGAIGLFVALAIIMFASRKIEWYKKAENDYKTTPPTPPHIYTENQNIPNHQD